MTLSNFISTLKEQNQVELAIELTELTLPIWKEYAGKNQLIYRDSVVGIRHKVNEDILERTLKIAKDVVQNKFSTSAKINNLQKEFTDPIVALQDLDWELPSSVEKTFYAFHNLLEKISGVQETVFKDSQTYIIANQAIDALIEAKLMTEEELKDLLRKYKTAHNIT